MSGRFFIETWGCQMNELDTQRMSGQLMQQGMLPTRDAAEASVILLNSCSVREKAAHKAYSRLGEYRLLKAENQELVIGFCGCVAQQEGEAAMKRVPELDFVVGTGRVAELGRVVEQARQGDRVVATGFPQDRHYDMDSICREGSYKGMVTIIEGCNKKCTFCIVPTTRGPELSRPMAAIEEEVRHLVDFGFREIELLGQTVNHWREPAVDGCGEELDFADLLNRVAGISGVERLRFVTSYPRDFTDRMVDAIGSNRNICQYLHLPVQSGSNRVLKTMGRGYEIESYRTLIEKLREARPDLALSTDLIVGFPGETEEDFEQTLDLIEEIRFASLFAFKYSPRPGTAALRLRSAEVPEAVGDDRLQRLFATQTSIQRELNEELVGQTHDVLVTGYSREPGFQKGRTSCHRIVHFDALGEPSNLGEITSVQITLANDHSLMGERLPLTQTAIG